MFVGKSFRDPQAPHAVQASDPIIPDVRVRRDDGVNPRQGSFLNLVQDEIEAINTRPEREGRPIGINTINEDSVLGVVGLALSGGGIRSSATCLGVLQALHHHGWINKIDYLSTVSGGGYIGSALTSTMAQGGKFVFAAGADNATAEEVSDTQAVGHIRNYSNYLFPNGLRDVTTALAIVIRGLVANFGLVLPFVLMCVILTIYSTPKRSLLGKPNFFGFVFQGFTQNELAWDYLPFLFWCVLGGAVAGIAWVIYDAARGKSIEGDLFWLYLIGVGFGLGIVVEIARRWLPTQLFSMTLTALALAFGYFLIWAFVRSYARRGEFGGHGPTVASTMLGVIAGIAFFEFQPFMVAAMFDAAEHTSTANHPVAGVVSEAIKWIAALAAPFTAAVTFFRQKFGELIKLESSNSWTKQAMAWAAKLALWIGGAALPLLIWVGYLYLCFWAVENDCKTMVRPQGCPAIVAAADTKALAGTLALDGNTGAFSAELKPVADARPVDKASDSSADHAPAWLAALRPQILYDYGAIALALLLFTNLFTANANSLHRLYRDRLSKAFLFKVNAEERAAGRNETAPSQSVVFPPNDDVQLSSLWPLFGPLPNVRRLRGPYHLINAALNVQGSDFANRRGRNADFFLFSPRYIGSDATGYCSTRRFENVWGIDMPTAMAISGAAYSSNMGAESIRPLTPTLALMNVRLGYWLKNPRYVDRDINWLERNLGSVLGNAYLWSELSGRLYESSDDVYITDGGHIENLGVYQLLRRRCRLIIAVDAEADAGINFNSLMTLQRYARIDLGIRIDLPWEPIKSTTRGWMCHNEGSSSQDLKRSNGPHVAIGTIDYGSGRKGCLVYIKSSLTGDESDYIRDYARRNPTFPHESTIDQMFTEEQFEVYRALGFHMVHGWMSGTDGVAASAAGYSTYEAVCRLLRLKS